MKSSRLKNMLALGALAIGFVVMSAGAVQVWAGCDGDSKCNNGCKLVNGSASGGCNKVNGKACNDCTCKKVSSKAECK